MTQFYHNLPRTEPFHQKRRGITAFVNTEIERLPLWKCSAESTRLTNYFLRCVETAVFETRVANVTGFSGKCVCVTSCRGSSVALTLLELPSFFQDIDINMNLALSFSNNTHLFFLDLLALYEIMIN